ncbi:ankyrin [Lophiostoma macrostomum CBS 122681]|uniref:Ankyrin n=1 Tax=Lophiostoma macrostomum CBS 122681 TaxID=1314788 RepID=A0A6A6T4D5_9PLEO|nr:ankyrin [Lophiostoma macrostomum CBS 122681]
MAVTAAVDANSGITANGVTSHEPSFNPTTPQNKSGRPAERFSWKSLPSSLNVSEKTSAQLGWAIALLCLLFTIVTLSPTFKAETATEKALKLAEWTALKDYIEECREELAAGIQSQACVRATESTLPPPPYVEATDNMKRDQLKGSYGLNATTTTAQHSTLGQYLLHDARPMLIPVVLIFVCTTFVVAFMSSTKVAQESHEKRDDTAPSSSTYYEAETATGTVRYPPPSSEVALRRRAIRTHPIYRHSSLDSAIHHGDVTEIRTRLQNGEDVNQHWPYLIYRLAISPKSEVTAKRLQVAQLCLDFGADVNALKGWNGQSALMIAIHFGNVDVAKLLILSGATICYASPDSNITALHRCVRLAVTGSAIDALVIMNLLFDHGAKANQADSLGKTALYNILIDAWLSRHDKECVEKLYPIAVCLLNHGALIPAFIREKYTMDNPLWDVIQIVSSNCVLQVRLAEACRTEHPDQVL